MDNITGINELMNLHAFFNELRCNLGAVWLEQDSVRFSAPEKFQNQETYDFIKYNKGYISSVLKENNIKSADNFLKKPVLKNSSSSYFPLSPAQERLWFFEQFEEGSNAYHLPELFELYPDTNILGLKYALDQIVKRHEVLRSTIEQPDYLDHAIQIIHDTPLIVEELYLTDHLDFETQIKEDINRPFDLGNEYPIRIKFYHIHSKDILTDNQQNKTLLLVNMHHIASDGWSIDLFHKELDTYYKAYLKNDLSFRLPDLEIQYKDYARWQKAYLTGDILDKQLSYWNEKLSGYEPLVFPTDYLRPDRTNFIGANHSFVISGEVSNNLRNIAKILGTTINCVLLSGFNILLGKYCGQNDIITGSPIANRHHRQTEDMIGFFVNTQVNRVHLKKDQSFRELLQEVQAQLIEAQSNQDLPFEKLVEKLGTDRDISRHPIFQVMFGVQSFGNQENSSDQKNNYLKPASINNTYEVERFDFSVFINDSREELSGQISYITCLFHKNTIERFASHFCFLLEQLAISPDLPYSQIGLMRTEEYNRIVFKWNETDKYYTENRTIHELFEEQVKKTPDSVALVYEGECLTYKTLNENSNRLARLIRAKYRQNTNEEMEPDTLIALYLDRCLEMVIGILAVLKAGGAYVPVDVNYPSDRVDYMLSDSSASLILTKRSGSEMLCRLPEEKILCIDLSETFFETENSNNLEKHNVAADLAYVIYTSGTTGKPKGVMINHSGIVNRLEWMQSMYHLTEDDVVLQKTPYVFDVSVWEILWANWYGAKIVLAKPDGHKDSSYLHELIKKQGVTTLHFVPSMLNACNRYLTEKNEKFSETIRQIFCSGEALSRKTAEQAYYNAGSTQFRLHNLYGPTEASIDVTYFETSRKGNVYIGRPIQNTQAYVLDTDFVPVPAGVAGELYIGGAGLARGYINRPDLTQERFVANPFATERNKELGYNRLYKTGDLVRWLEDGNLEFLGRNDDQIKVRGYRIEPGEIEMAMMQVKGIHQSCVLTKERSAETGRNQYLVGYYILAVGDRKLSDDFIKAELSRLLPEYMIPDLFIEMDIFPLTVNGKLNKKAFPEPDFGQNLIEYVGPGTINEEKICQVWQAILGLERVGLTDDFFRIGGNSILAIQLSHRMSEVIASDVKVSDVFKHRTISRILSGIMGREQVIIPRIEGDRGFLSFAQERLWFIEQYEEGTNAYHMPSVYELDSSTDIEGIKYALTQIVSRHEVLRSTIERLADGSGIQQVHTEPLKIEERTLTHKDDYNVIIGEDINSPFDLSIGYPVRVIFYFIQTEPSEPVCNGKTMLLINIHHIASDGWSRDIFQKELFSFYSAFITKDQDFRLPPLDIQYKDYAAWQKNYLTGPLLEKQLYFWREKLEGYKNLEFPSDFPRPVNKDYKGSSQFFQITENVSRTLRSLTKQLGVTMHSLLLSSINVLLGKYSGQEDIVTGSVMANRHYQQTEGLIGFFVNSQVNRTILNSSQSFEELVKQVHEEQVQMQSFQDLPFEKLVSDLGVDRDTSMHPIFQVSFVVQSFGRTDKASGLQKNYLKPYYDDGFDATTKFDLSFFIDDSESCIQGHINYATSLYGSDTIKRLIEHYINLLCKLAAAPGNNYSQLSLLNPEEFDTVVYKWNATDVEYPKNMTIHQLFEQQVERTPDKIALKFEDQQLTYSELNVKSNQLARYIREKYLEKTKQELKSDTLIALFLDRSLDMVTGILAVLKAGGAYVPIDPDYPKDRIDFIMNDTHAELVLSHRQLANIGNSKIRQEKLILISGKDEINTQESTNLQKPYSTSDLVYVIYTSGTTGIPKGVKITHKSLSNLVFAQQNALEINAASKVLQFTSLTFDPSALEIFCALSAGAELIIANREIRQDALLLSDYLLNAKISFANIPPVLLSSMPDIYLPELETLMVGGDVTSLETMNLWSKGRRLVNAYGPTEGTIIATLHTFKPGDKSNIIGKPIANTRVYVLDIDLNPVPVGVKGELYIGGAGVAAGYLNRPDLTDQRFIINPFQGESDKINGYNILYKTGDLVRWLPDGYLEFAGRNDNQVKIRGYRIELGEIEHVLSSIPGIKQSCVLVKERKTELGTNKYLAGYYVADSDYISGKANEILATWEKLYDDEYEIQIIEEDKSPDFSGWNSFITGLPLPLAEMEEWRNGILGIIERLNPTNVLEIGVGSGLIMYPLLNSIEKYVGLDISQAVINRHKKQLEGNNSNTRFFHLKADQVDQLPDEELFDTIIINSVCQYFPDINYFNLVLEKAISKLTENGSIFLGDVRNYDLYKDLVREKWIFEGKDFTQHEIERFALKENELLLAPGYFIDLGKRNEYLCIAILPRANGYENELSKYRYDVIITLKGKGETANWNTSGNATISLKTSFSEYYNAPFFNQISNNEIINKLAGILPSYMIPDTLIAMERFPLTVNGKLDKKALPDPELGENSKEYLAPVSETEAVLCRIWQQVLGIERIGITEDFFRIGGDSILSIQISTRIRQAGLNCQVKDIFECKTIHKLAKHLLNKQIELTILAEHGVLSGGLNFLPIQQWFIEKTSNGEITFPNHWNQSFLIKVPELDINKLKLVIPQVVAYHDVLRVKFHQENTFAGWKQIYQPEIDIPELKTLNVSKYSDKEIQDVLTLWQSGFNLETGPLFQAGYLYGYQDGSARIFLALHHMVTDAVSWHILRDDIKTLYDGKVLQQKGTSYRQWVETVKAYTHRHPGEITWWENQVNGLSGYSINGLSAPPESAFIELDKTVTGLLLHTAPKAYNTEINDLLLTAVAYVLKEINQCDIHAISLEGHGREDIEEQIDHSRTIGWFTTLYPVKLELKSNFRESIQFIKESLRKIPNKGIGFAAFATDSSTEIMLEDLPKISFNYLGQFDNRDEFWQIISDGSGTTIHPDNADNNLITINGMVNNGRLGFSIITRLGKEKTQQVNEWFKIYLKNITEHCCESFANSGTIYSPADFNSVSISQSLIDRLHSSARAAKNEIAYIYPATSLQQGFIYHNLSITEDDAYREQILYDYHESLDTSKFIEAWELCIAQYPILRTAFNWEEDIIQIIYKKCNSNYYLHDLSNLTSQKARDEAIRSIQLEDSKIRFDLTKPGHQRLYIIKHTEVYYTIYISNHHIILDGWSGPILQAALHQHYQTLKARKNVVIKEDISYIQVQEYISKHKYALNDYWQKEMTGADNANDINSMLSSSIDLTNYKQVEHFNSDLIEITGTLFNDLKDFTNREGLTLNVVVQFAWHKLLQVYSNSLQTIVGSTVSGRDLPINIDGILESVGLFINTLPLIIRWDNENSVQIQMLEIQRKITDMNTYNFADLANLQKNGERIFHSLFIFENYPVPKGAENLSNIIARHTSVKLDYPLSIMAYERRGTLGINLQYDSKYLSRAKAKKHLDVLKSIIEQAINNPYKSHKQISAISAEEFKQMVYDWNQTAITCQDNKTINQLFQEQALKSPDNIALVYEGDQLTYKELNEKSNQLARYIRTQYLDKTGQELKPDTLIALFTDRSLEMVTGILAVLKAGGAYVPIDAKYPQDRITYILEDTRSELILCRRQLSKSGQTKLPEDKILYIDLSEELYGYEATSDLYHHSYSTDLAYVIYTSGTTGKPKGVMVTHSNVLRLFNATDHQFGFTDCDVWTLFHSYVFDFSVWELWGALLYGGKLMVITAEQTKDFERFFHLCLENKVTVLNLTPSAFYRFSEIAGSRELPLLSLRYIIFGGEALNTQQLRPWWHYHKQKKLYARLINMYGITETTVHVTYKEIKEDEVVKSNIGKRLSDLQLYVLDLNNNPVPKGVSGELYVGGAGLARGYLNRSELTEERFINNPYATGADKEKGFTRLYKTGDLVRWLADGSLEYLGRNDDQVKIRGYRIELGEVEQALTLISGIKQCCVIAKERKTETGNNKYLVGYYVLKSNTEGVTDAIIFARLAELLPEYMVPEALIQVESFQLTINGKLDKRALPDPDFSSLSEYVEPTNETETAICKIWQKAIGIELVGITDDFFRIGGNSILAIQVSHKISKELECDIRVSDLFIYKDVRSLSNYIVAGRIKTKETVFEF